VADVGCTAVLDRPVRNNRNSAHPLRRAPEYVDGERTGPFRNRAVFRGFGKPLPIWPGRDALRLSDTPMGNWAEDDLMAFSYIPPSYVPL
jgi:hypothetical protein